MRERTGTARQVFPEDGARSRLRGSQKRQYLSGQEAGEGVSQELRVRADLGQSQVISGEFNSLLSGK